MRLHPLELRRALTQIALAKLCGELDLMAWVLVLYYLKQTGPAERNTL